MRSCRIFVIATLIFALSLSCTKHNENVIAIIGEHVVETDKFIARYKAIKKEIQLPDNGQTRLEIFHTIINEELFILEALNRGYHQDDVGRFEYEKLTTQALLHTYNKKVIPQHYQIFQDELKELYIRLNTKIKARHLYASSKNQADSLYAELENGKPFEQLAKENFKDPQLRDTGGSLGYFTVDEMDAAFEDAAFALDIGQISGPIRTAQGYSIIQVQDRITRPLLTESEYVKHRPKLENYLRYRKRKKAIQLYVDSLRQHLHISFNEPVINKLYQRLIKNKSNSKIEEDIFFSDDGLLKNKELVRSRIGVWDVNTFQKYAKFTSEGQQKWIRNRENLENFIAGLVVRAFMLSEAKDSGMHKSSAYQIEVQQMIDDYLLQRMNQVVVEATKIPEDTLQSYFQQNQNQFITPPKIHLSEIALNSEIEAEEVKSKLLKKMPFEQLAKEYSVQRWSAEKEGDIGLFTYNDLGSYADRLFKLKVDHWVGPIKMDERYAFFKCIGHFPEQIRTFSEVRSEIEKILQPIWKKKTKKRILESIHKKINVVTYPEKLKSLQLN